MVQSFRRTFCFQSQYELLEERPTNELFPHAMVQTWHQKKRELLCELSEHQDAVRKLMEARKECWMSESKVKKYKLITSVHTYAHRHNPEDLKGRTKALRDMQKVLVNKEEVHIKACESFKEMLLVEINLRETIHKSRAQTCPWETSCARAASTQSSTPTINHSKCTASFNMAPNTRLSPRQHVSTLT
ncbi:uncharacterized protein LOC127865234 isoform X9 [Dreissena polymorpha]|nr:uncharacterized protein LOC127865234 isoform X7 [Dreissena polymorpha]XP_052261222.1 uncharacterized protein LOC127865234 isoform X8 [Dreissena polymorpha]XP_052261223.1 uncharacterized protein LOC127865234 isoform X9 [Dreissena polymorpha]XP_052261224.1 uncharacterized protein LOC127865234 isoform X10 [Dreissena polymorpha]XP_052261225.1 uncharacterized protein LOC127865234 isoform X9 [Dreissena polymorpha]